jgi:NMD protein affecting ribosome stability and mRNA decay
MKECPRCGAVYDGHRWIPEPGEELKRELSKKPHEIKLCPGDQRLDKRQVEGIVRLSGLFMRPHIDEIKNVINRVAREGRRRNVAARIFEVAEEDDTLVIETTDEHLAERMGKEVEKAFKGNLEIKWQEKDTFARVVWQRD